MSYSPAKWTTLNPIVALQWDRLTSPMQGYLGSGGTLSQRRGVQPTRGISQLRLDVTTSLVTAARIRIEDAEWKTRSRSSSKRPGGAIRRRRRIGGCFLALVSALRAAPIPEAPVLAPSFDHAVKDPKDDDIAVLPQHRIVVLEGNYVALDGDVWRDAAALLDELWFVEVDYEVARRRLRERHVRAGIVKDIEEGDRRAVENDLPNGDEILKNRLKIDEVVYSREDGGWVHE
ncbi:hypothetical protein AUP68_01962 [Ilyonectria robusta]